jgi:hypothetical protein
MTPTESEGETRTARSFPLVAAMVRVQIVVPGNRCATHFALIPMAAAFASISADVEFDGAVETLQSVTASRTAGLSQAKEGLRSATAIPGASDTTQLSSNGSLRPLLIETSEREDDVFVRALMKCAAEES